MTLLNIIIIKLENAQENPEQSSYQGKILIIYLLLLNCQTTIRKFSDKLE